MNLLDLAGLFGLLYLLGHLVAGLLEELIDPHTCDLSAFYRCNDILFLILGWICVVLLLLWLI